VRDILDDLDRWAGENLPIALATVIETWGSAPRRVGANMAITTSGSMAGSVSGGCVENAVVEGARDSLSDKRPRLLKFSVADETAWGVGLACGGRIEVFVRPLDTSLLPVLHAVLGEDDQAVLATIVRGSTRTLGRELIVRANGSTDGSVGNEWDQVVLKLAQEALSQGLSRRMALNEATEIFLEVILPVPTLIVVGGVHIAQALVAFGKTLGYRTVVIDPRRAWGNAERFGGVDQLIQAWPEQAFRQVRVTRTTAIAALTHDPKLDDPALQIALETQAFYVGALGSRATHARRRARLLEAGVTESQLSRIHAPIGMEIGADSPEEIALAIMADVTAAYHERAQ